MTVERAESAPAALELLKEAATKAAELQRELDQIAPRKPMHQFRSLRWGVTVPTGNYSSARLDAEVNVDPDAAPEEVLAQLKSWVGQHAPVSDQDLDRMEREAAQWRDELGRLRAQTEEARRQYEKVLVVFTRMGIEVPSDVREDLPF